MAIARFFVALTTIGCLGTFLPEVSAFSSPSNQRVFVGTPSKPIKRLVSECMTPRKHMHLFTPSMSVDEGISILLEYGISGAPVVDPDTGKLLGMVSSSDFMLQDYAGALLDLEGSPDRVENLINLAKRIVGKSVGEVMSSNIAYIRSNEPMAKAADKMARQNIHRLIVVNPKDDTFIGILTRADAMRDVLTTVQAALPERATIDAKTDSDNSNVKP